MSAENVSEELRKRRREALRGRGQPVYTQPGKRERKVLAKLKARGGYSHAQLAADFARQGNRRNLAQRMYDAFRAWGPT